MRDLTLFGFGPSVYTRVVRIALAEKSLPYRYIDVNPFDEMQSGNPHPFGRVPVLVDGGFEVYETAAITRYLDTAYPQVSLTPADPGAAARMVQVICIVDAYGYWPMVRRVFGHRVFRPTEGLAADEEEIKAGLAASLPVLDSLERIAAEGLVLHGACATLAECHLAPMIAAFSAAPEGAAALRSRNALSRWWNSWSSRPSVLATDSGFDQPFRLSDTNLEIGRQQDPPQPIAFGKGD